MIGVIGCGNMSQAIVQGYAKKNIKAQFLTYTPSFTRADDLAKKVSGRAVKELSELSAVDTLLIACKPQQLNDLVDNINNSEIDLSSKHIISILAATPISTLKEKLKADRISRVMPNTPSLIGKGMSLVIHSDEVDELEKDLVQKFFSACGEVSNMPNEVLFDQVTTVSGSGPAYVYLFAETMAEKLISWGLDKKEAKKIAIQLFCGSSELMSEQSEESFSELIAKVTSKGGVTIEAVKSYQQNNLSKLTSNALDAALSRSLEITKELNSK